MILKDDKGSFTVEAAVIVPIVITIIIVFLLLTVKRFDSAIEQTEKIKLKYGGSERNPVSIINNTDLIIEYIDKLKSYLKEESK